MSGLWWRSCAVLLVFLLPLATFSRPSAAHEPVRPQSRELVRAQGYLGKPPAGAAALRTVELAVLGETRHLHATEWRRYGAEEKQEPLQMEEPAQITVQGARGDLQRLRKARPDQRVTLLAERRAGSTDLFLLALDLCPPD